jgi:hypothetical protein
MREVMGEAVVVCHLVVVPHQPRQSALSRDRLQFNFDH